MKGSDTLTHFTQLMTSHVINMLQFNVHLCV